MTYYDIYDIDPECPSWIEAAANDIAQYANCNSLTVAEIISKHLAIYIEGELRHIRENREKIKQLRGEKH